MKLRNLIFILTAFIASVLPAAAASLTEQADSAYSAGKYQEAAEGYMRVIKEQGVSAPLYYNLGNAEYRQGHLGLAILNYERALRIDPTFSQARKNLEFVNTKIVDRPGMRGTFLGNACDTLANQAASDTWAWIAFALFVLVCLLVAMYLFTTDVRRRKIGFFGAIVMFALSVAAFLLAQRAARIATDSSTAIVTAPSAILSTSPRQPRDRNEEALLLHEGTRLTILDSVKAVADSVPALWLDVEIDNEHRAWIRATDVERVR